MSVGTLSPAPRLTLLDSNGNPVNNGKIYTYVAGTSTPQATYTDVGLQVANANPIRTDPAGRCVIFLPPGTSYKFIAKDANDVLLWSQDNIANVPGSSTALVVVGTAGQNLTANEAVYLSDGSNSKTAGLWYPADNTQPYSAVTVQVGIATSDITSGTVGGIAIGGNLGGFSSLTVGSLYYVGAAGAITATAPSIRRVLGQADSTTSLVLQISGPQQIRPSFPHGRLTLTTNVPITIADVTAAATIYFTPYQGDYLTLYDGVGSWYDFYFSQISGAVPATTNQMYDVFVYNNAGTLTLEFVAWTNDTTRATALAQQDNVYVKTGALTHLYLSSCRTTGVSGQTEDSFAKRYVWNYYNRVRRICRRLETTATWNWTNSTYQQANNAVANQLDVVIGVAEVAIHAQVMGAAQNGSSSPIINVAIGEDGLTVVPGCVLAGASVTSGATYAVPEAFLDKYPAIGRHYYPWLERSDAGGTTVWQGTATNFGTGISGWIDG